MRRHRTTCIPSFPKLAASAAGTEVGISRTPLRGKATPRDGSGRPGSQPRSDLVDYQPRYHLHVFRSLGSTQKDGAAEPSTSQDTL